MKIWSSMSTTSVSQLVVRFSFKHANYNACFHACVALMTSKDIALYINVLPSCNNIVSCYFRLPRLWTSHPPELHKETLQQCRYCCSSTPNLTLSRWAAHAPAIESENWRRRSSYRQPWEKVLGICTQARIAGNVDIAVHRHLISRYHDDQRTRQQFDLKTGGTVQVTGTRGGKQTFSVFVQK